MNVRDVLRSSPLRRPYAKVKLRLSSTAREELFTGFYRGNVWGDEQSVSGSGSNLDETEAIRDALPGMLEERGITSLLDVPCGDFYWMQGVDLGDIKYIGGDIVSEMIDSLEKIFGGPNRRFTRLDLASDGLPEADAVMVRDLFLHLPIAVVLKAIENIKTSGATWLLTSDYPSSLSNPDVEMGRHRFLNLTLPPFSWPQPQTAVQESLGERSDKRLGIWRIADLP